MTFISKAGIRQQVPDSQTQQWIARGWTADAGDVAPGAPSGGVGALTDATGIGKALLRAADVAAVQALLGIAGSTVQNVRCTADEAPVNASTALVSSTYLTVPLAANSVYAFDGVLFYDSSTTADLTLGWAVPSGASGTWTSDGIINTSTIAAGQVRRPGLAITATGNLGGAGVGTIVSARPSGTVVTGANAGNLVMKYAQTASDATNTTLRALSRLRLDKIA